MFRLNIAAPLQQSTAAAEKDDSHNRTSSDQDFAKGAADDGNLDYANGEADTRSESSAGNQPFHYILSLSTGMFVAITKSGRVQGNAQIGKHSTLLATRVRMFH